MSFQKHLFTVTRQNQWPEGTLCVEISQGGYDYSNPGMLGVKYRNLGEGDTFEGLTPAVEAGIAVYNAWKKDNPDAKLGIAIGNTDGNTLPFDGQELTEELAKDLRLKAQEFDETLETCDQCGAILGETRYGNADAGEYNCCSESCAEKYWAIPEEECPNCGDPVTNDYYEGYCCGHCMNHAKGDPCPKGCEFCEDDI